MSSGVIWVRFFTGIEKISDFLRDSVINTRRPASQLLDFQFDDIVSAGGHVGAQLNEIRRLVEYFEARCARARCKPVILLLTGLTSGSFMLFQGSGVIE
jgi:hypothetical protein